MDCSELLREYQVKIHAAALLSCKIKHVSKYNRSP